MRLIILMGNYLDWHYGVAYGDIFYVWRNYLWFVNHLFSVPDVLGSLFAPFKRLQEKKVNLIKSPEEFFSNILVNFIMRIVGFIIRSVLLLVALVGFIVVFSVGMLTFLVWAILPGLILYLLLLGFYSFAQ